MALESGSMRVERNYFKTKTEALEDIARQDLWRTATT